MKVLRNADVGRVRVKKRMSQIEGSGNLTLALQAMKQDGVKLVNIGEIKFWLQLILKILSFFNLAR